jgi:hypothetical protein
MGMYLFALVMIVLNLAAFGVDSGVLFLRHYQRETTDYTDYTDGTDKEAQA